MARENGKRLVEDGYVQATASLLTDAGKSYVKASA
jgi:hypothetical protein